MERGPPALRQSLLQLSLDRCQFSRWRQTLCGGQRRRNLYFSNHAVSIAEPQPVRHQPPPFLDRALDRFRVAAELRSGGEELDRSDEHTQAEFDKPEQ